MAKHKEFRMSFTFDGKRYEVEADSEIELGVKLGTKKRELEQGKIRITKTMPVKEWGKEYLEKYKKPFVSDYQFSNLETEMKIISRIIGNIKVKDVKNLHCQQVLASMSGMSRGYVCKVRQLLFSMFDEAIEEGLVYKNPAIRLKLPVNLKQKENRRPISRKEKDILLKVGERLGDPFDAYIKLMLYFGLRPSEACRVQYCHFSLDIEYKKLYVIGTKTENSTRDIPVPEHLIEWIKKYKDNPFAPFIKRRDNGAANECTRDGMWRAIRREAHIMLGGKVYRNEVKPPYPLDQKITAYCLRHTYASDMITLGIPKEIVSLLMGHANIDTTDTYIRMTEEMFSLASNKLNDDEMCISNR